MKKIKLLTPILGLSALSASLIPLATSCAKEEKKSDDKVVPTDLIGVTSSNHCTGLADGADLSAYNTISIPETVQVIDEGAFDGKIPANITKLILPNSVRTIEDKAFANNSSIKTIDVSTWTEQTINWAALGSQSSNDDRPFAGLESDGKFIYSSSLSDAAKKQLIQKFKDAGVPASWFVDATEGNISFYNKELTTTNKSGMAEFDFSLAKEIVSPASLVAEIYQTGQSSSDVTIQLNSVDVSRKSIKVSLAKAIALANNDYAEFSVKFICYNNTEKTSIAWVENISGLKLTYQYKAEVKAIKASINRPSYTVGETIQLTDINITAKYEGSEEFVPISCEKAWDVQASDNYTFTTEDVNNGYKIFNITAENCNCSIDITVDPEATLAGLEFHEVYDSNGKVASYEVCRNWSYGKSMANVVIPALYNGLPVTGLYGHDAFFNAKIRPAYIGTISQIETLYIPNTITNIPDNAFYQSPSLRSVTIAHNSKLEKIGDTAFYSCGNLTTLDLPESVKYIGLNAFQDTGLPKITDTNGYTYMKISGNEYYLLLSGPSSATSELYNSQCKFLGKLDFENLQVSTDELVLPEGLIGICPNAFSGSIYFEKLTLPESLKSLGQNLFTKTAWVAGDSLDFVIPKNVSYLAGNPVASWVDVALSVDADNPYYMFDSDTEVLYSKDKTVLVGSMPWTESKLTIPNTVKTISRYAFTYCARELVMPTSLEEIEPLGFSSMGIPSMGMSPIELLDFSKCTKLTHIGWKAIYNIYCYKIVLPESITSIDFEAFDSVKFNSINIPAAVTTIDDRAFFVCQAIDDDRIGITFADVTGWSVYNSDNNTTTSIDPDYLAYPDIAMDMLCTGFSTYCTWTKK